MAGDSLWEEAARGSKCSHSSRHCITACVCLSCGVEDLITLSVRPSLTVGVSGCRHEFDRGDVGECPKSSFLDSFGLKQVGLGQVTTHGISGLDGVSAYLYLKDSLG